MKQNLSTFLILTIAMFIGFNCIKPTPTPGPRPPAKSDSEKCEPKWYKKNKTVEGMIYGVGLGETSDRRVAKNISFASAVRDINSQITTKVIADLDVTFNDLYTEIDGDHVRDFKTGVRDNLLSKTKEDCQGCIREEFSDCETNGVWSAYSLVQLDFNGWRNTIMKGIYDEEMDKAADQIKAQRDEFYKRNGLD